MTTVSEFIMEELARRGVEHVFVLPGGGAMHLVDALARNDRLTPVPMLHEQAVGIAAEAYSQFRNGLGAALVTSGPGATNAITAVAAAWLDSTPCVFVSGQVKSEDLASSRGTRQFGFQEIDITSVVSPITKRAVQITDSQSAAVCVRKAISLALEGRPGPVWIDVPLDLQAQEIPPSEVAELPDRGAMIEMAPKPLVGRSPTGVTEVVQMLERVRRPLFLIGNGLRLSGSQEVLMSVLRECRIPIVTTWKALDVVAYDDPLFAGRPGSIAQHFANLTQQACDLLVCVGARLDLGQLGYRHDTFAPHARIVVVDVDEAELGKFSFRPGSYMPVHADASGFVAELAAILPTASLPDWSAWREQIADWKLRFPETTEDDEHWVDGVSQYSLVQEVSRQMTTNHILVPGSSGACSEVVMQAFRNKQGQRVFNTEGLGPMGFGIPAAIGACVASGGRPVVSIDGDGGFAMNIQELQTVAFQRLPIAFFVLDNNGYASIRSTSNNYFSGRKVGCDPESGLQIPDYERLGPAFGISTQVIRRKSDLAHGVTLALSGTLPSITVVKIGGQSYTHPRLSSRQLPDGRMQTNPMHQLNPLYPGLDPESEIARVASQI